MTHEALQSAFGKIVAHAKAHPHAKVADIAHATGVPMPIVVNLGRTLAARKKAIVYAPTPEPEPPNSSIDGELLDTDFADCAMVPTDPEFYTDFDQLVADTADSQVNEDGTPASGLQQAASFRRLQDERRLVEAPQVRITPRSVRELTVLGNIVVLTSGASALSTVNWTGENDETQAVTVTIGRIDGTGVNTFPQGGTLTPIATFSYRPRARIVWGAHGCNYEMFVDVGRGQQFTVNCSSIYIDLFMDAPQAGTVAGTMSLKATLGFFSTNRQTPTTYTNYVDSLVSGTPSAAITIPPFAQTVMVLPLVVGSIVGSVLNVYVQDTNGTIISSQQFDSECMTLPMWLPNDGYAVTYNFTQSGGGTVPARVIFGLAA